MSNILDNKIKISGSIGMVKLQINNKNIYIFYDDHSNNKYCESKNSIFLYDLFENLISNNSDYIILLEEPFTNNYSNIKFLWNNTPHVIKFRNFYKKHIHKCSDIKSCYVYPIDIRLILCDVSYDELLLNINNKDYFKDYDITTFEYFRYLLYLFDLIEITNNIFKNKKYEKNIIFIKKIFNLFTKTKYYNKLKIQFIILYNYYIKPNLNIKIYDFVLLFKFGIYDFSTGYPYENINNNLTKYDFINEYDKLINGIMEFYMFILATKLTSNNIIIYAGYYHSNNLTYILKKYYKYKLTYNIGNTENIKNESEITNCLYIDKNIF